MYNDGTTALISSSNSTHISHKYNYQKLLCSTVECVFVGFRRPSISQVYLSINWSSLRAALKVLVVGENAKYTHHQIVKELQEALAIDVVAWRDMNYNSPRYIMVDESTDILTRKSLIIYSKLLIKGQQVSWLGSAGYVLFILSHSYTQTEGNEAGAWTPCNQAKWVSVLSFHHALAARIENECREDYTALGLFKAVTSYQFFSLILLLDSDIGGV